MKGQKTPIRAFSDLLVRRSNIIVLTVLLCSAGTMAAGELSGCGTCQGSVYYLTYQMVAQNQTQTINGIDRQVDVVKVFYTIDTSLYRPSDGTVGQVYLDQVAQKVSSTVYLSTLLDGPNGSGQAGHADLWHLEFGGINANGCSEKGGGFECADFKSTAPPGVTVPNKTTMLQWIFEDTIPTGTLFTGTSASIKARYVDTNGNKVGALVSENIRLTPQPSGQVPEPASLALLASAAALTGFGVRSRRQKDSRR